MGWRPWEVRRCDLSDFGAAVNGWLRAHGINPADPPVKRFTRDDLERLKAKVANG